MEIRELGHVVLYVTNLQRVATFYREILGFNEVAQKPGMAVFSSGRTHHELLLIEVGGIPQVSRAPRPGLYHIGFKIGDTIDELKAAKRELEAAGVTIVGSSDHGMTNSLYIKDPDGNELELYVDVSDEWREHPETILSHPKALDL